jgi:hypothetical protein
MSFYHGPTIVTNGLVLNLDAADRNSYPGSGTTWFDVSGNGKNATLTNGASFSNNAMVFDATNDLASVSNPLNQSNLTQEWSVLAWVNVSVNAGGTAYLVDGLNNGLSVSWFDVAPLLYLNSGANDYYTYGSGNIEGIGWTHLAFRFKNSNGYRTIWKNGVENGNANGPNNTSTPSGQASTFNIGNGMGGSISCIQFYNRQLTDAEVLQNYNAQKSRFGLS